MTKRPQRVLRVPTLAAFLKEVPPVEGSATVYLISTERKVPVRGMAMARIEFGLSLQGVNARDAIVWLYEQHSASWGQDGPWTPLDKAVYEEMKTLEAIVVDWLKIQGYDVRMGDFALPVSLSPLNARFECARWERNGDDGVKVMPVK